MTKDTGEFRRIVRIKQFCVANENYVLRKTNDSSQNKEFENVFLVIKQTTLPNLNKANESEKSRSVEIIHVFVQIDTAKWQVKIKLNYVRIVL